MKSLLLAQSFSNNLIITFVRDIGLNWAHCMRGVSLGIGLRLADFHRKGTHWCSSDMLNIFVIELNISKNLSMASRKVKDAFFCFSKNRSTVDTSIFGILVSMGM